jgi:hypothetical protein
MLQGIEAQVNQVGGFRMAKDTEYATFIMERIEITFVGVNFDPKLGSFPAAAGRLGQNQSELRRRWIS